MRNLQCIPNVFALSLTMLTPCPRSHRFFTNIFAKKKKFAKLFSPVHIGPRSNLLTKNKLVKNLVTLSLANFKFQIIVCFYERRHQESSLSFKKVLKVLDKGIHFKEHKIVYSTFGSSTFLRDDGSLRIIIRKQ